MSGTDANPAIAGFDPGVGADLYITNGTTDDYAHAVTNTLGWTPELSEGCDGCGFVFPDDEALIEAEFQKNLPFALDVAKSAPNPAQPVSHLGNTTKPFYLDLSAIDPEKTNNPMSDFRFSVSYGDPQPVQVLARRSLGAVTLKYQINGGAAQSGSTSEWAANASETSTTSTTGSCAGASRARIRATSSRCGSRPRAARSRATRSRIPRWSSPRTAF